MHEPRIEMTTESLNFDRVAERYDETRGGEARGRVFAADLVKILDRERLVVEVGVGTGVVSMALAELGLRVTGLDISEAMLARAKQRMGAGRVVQADAMQLPFASESVHQAVSVWVLHVVGDVPSVLREVARVLAPGGRYFVMDGRFFQTDDEGDPFTHVWHEISDGLGLPPRGNRADEWAALAPACGLRVNDIITVGPYESMDSAVELADRIESRVHSPLWNVSDDDWQRVVVPAIERLRSLPNADERVTQRDHQDILVLER